MIAQTFVQILENLRYYFGMGPENPEGANSIRDTFFGSCIGRRILDITQGEMGEDDWNKVYFHLDNGQTFFVTIGDIGEDLMGFLDMEAKDDDSTPTTDSGSQS